MNQNIDYQQGCLIVTDPSNLEGDWSFIVCLTDLTSLVLQDDNLSSGSEIWTDDEFKLHYEQVGRFKKISCTGKVALYA